MAVTTVHGVTPMRPREAAFSVGAHMTDKHRHRHTHAPHGHLPNWLLVVLLACAIVVSSLAPAII
jgi:hypothetical protein